MVSSRTILFLCPHCDLLSLPPSPAPIERWDDIPAPSADLETARMAIRRRVEALVEELTAERRRAMTGA